jgi:sec-independent protein translocase protein TatA
MGSLGWPEILLIDLVVILLFGAKKLPEIGKGLGEGIKSFRSAMRGGENDQTKGGPNDTSGGAGK